GLEERPGQRRALLAVVARGLVEDALDEAVLAEAVGLLAVEPEVEGEVAHERLADLVEVALAEVGADGALDEPAEHVEDVAAEAVALEGVHAAVVDHLALRVEHVVVLELALADAEVVLL